MQIKPGWKLFNINYRTFLIQKRNYSFSSLRTDAKLSSKISEPSIELKNHFHALFISTRSAKWALWAYIVIKSSATTLEGWCWNGAKRNYSALNYGARLQKKCAKHTLDCSTLCAPRSFSALAPHHLIQQRCMVWENLIHSFYSKTKDSACADGEREIHFVYDRLCVSV